MSPWTVPGFTEERELGRGGSGRVVSAVYDATGERAAIKYLHEKLVDDPEFLARFRAEAELLRSLNTPQVVRMYDYVEEPGQGAAIIMELIEGVSLYEMITRQGEASPEAALVVLKGSLVGLAAAHRLGIVHRDYKPENVLVDEEGDSKLSDFGVAVREGRSAPAAGTRLYMAPEQWNGGPATPASDIYAATAVFFECLTGKTPFSGRDLRRQHESAPVPVDLVDEPLRGLIERGMAKHPADRPADAREFMDELDETAFYAYGPDWEERGRGQMRERASSLLALLLIGAGGGGAGLALASTWLGRHRRAAYVGAAVAGAVVVTVAATAFAVAGGHHSSVSTGTLAGATVGSTTGNPTSQSSTSSPSPSASATATPTKKPTPGALTLTAAANVNPAAATHTCGTPAPPFTFTGTITASKATTVSYYWLVNGVPGAPQTLAFTQAETLAVNNDVHTPAGDTENATGSIVITSPQAATSAAAAYALTCTQPKPTIAVSVTSNPASPLTLGCANAPSPQAFTVTGTISSNKATTVTYEWTRSDKTSSGANTVSIGAGSSVTVTDTVTPASFGSTLTDTLEVTAPVSVSRGISLSETCTWPPVSIAAQQLPSGTASYTYQGATLTASGGDGTTYQWSATGLPPGLSIDPSSGTISGTVSASATIGSYTVTASATSGGQTGSQTFTIEIFSPIQ